MKMEECPKCKRLTVELNPKFERIECYNPKCDYIESVSIDDWYREHNALPKLMEVVEMNKRYYGVSNPPVELLKYLRTPND